MGFDQGLLGVLCEFLWLQQLSEGNLGPLRPDVVERGEQGGEVVDSFGPGVTPFLSYDA